LHASGGGLEVQVTPVRRAKSGPAFTCVILREKVPSTEGAARFREVLAAVVAVLGDPPIVGGPAAFARWRGTPLTAILTLEQWRAGTTAIRLDITPTGTIEREEYLQGSYDPILPPSHHWTTWPDTDAPEHD